MNLLGLFTGVNNVINLNDSLVNSEFIEALNLWQDIGAGRASWNAAAHSIKIPQQIAGRLSSIIQTEMHLESTRAELSSFIKKLDANISDIIIKLTINGGVLLRPIIFNKTLQFEAISLGGYLPISYNLSGEITAAYVLKEFQSIKDINSTYRRQYLLVERQEYNGSAHKITTNLYEVTHGTQKPISLTALPETKDLKPAVIWNAAPFPLITEVRSPAINLLNDTLPAPIIAGAEDLIRDADEQYNRMLWEQEGGELRVFADRDMFQKRQIRNGEVIGVKMTGGLNRLMTLLQGQEKQDVTTYAPALRTDMQNVMYQEILRRIELVTNIGKGTLSTLDEQQQTATQFTGGRQVLYSLIDKIEDEIEVKAKTLAKILDYEARAYNIAQSVQEAGKESAGEETGDDNLIKITYNDDQTRKDINVSKQQMLSEINSGIVDKWEYRARFYGESEEEAKKRVPIEEEEDPGFDEDDA